MKYMVICFIIVFVYRLLTNVSALIRLNYYDRKYTTYLSHPENNFAVYTDPIVRLFKAAGITDRSIPFVQPMGYGQGLAGHATLFMNIANRSNDAMANMLECFAEAKGTFRHRIIENFSPLFWINCVLFLPKTVLEYLGVKGESLITKVFQLLYWMAAPILVFFRDQIYEHVLSLIR